MDVVVVLAVPALFATGWAFVLLAGRLRDHADTGE
jgi:hypothetical protein